MRRWSILAVLLVLGVLFAACSGGDQITREEATPTAEPALTVEEPALAVRPDQPALYVVNQDGSGLRKLFEEGDSISFALSPDGQQIAVAASEPAGSVLYLLDAVSGEREEVTRAEGTMYLFGWSPDGKWLAMERFGGSVPYSGAYFYSFDSRSFEESPVAGAHFVTWSPTSDALLTTRSELYRVDLSSGEVKELARGIGNASGALSPDGEWLATAIVEPSGDHVIIMLRPDGSDHGELARFETQSPGVIGLAWSPDGRELAYGGPGMAESPGGREGGYGVYVIDVETSAARRLTGPTQGADRGIQWSPDGKRVLITRVVCTLCDSFGTKILLAAADGSGEVTLPGTDEFRHGAAAWSPDGARFVYTADALYVAEADGSNVRVLVDLPGSGYQPVAWSADGERIFMVRRSALPSTTYAVRPDGSDIELLGTGVSAVAPDGELVAVVTEEGLTIRGPQMEVSISIEGTVFTVVFSPDGSQGAVSFQGEVGNQLAIVGVNGDLRRLDTHGSFRGLNWSPDGTQLAYSSQDGVWAMDLAEEQLRLVAPTPRCCRVLDWSADGAEIAFFDDGAVRVVRTDGSGEERRLSAGDFDLFAPNELHWSPDGRHVAISGHKGLFVVAVETGETLHVADVEVRGFAWSPGGDRLVFGTSPNIDSALERGLYLVDVDGSKLIKLMQSAGLLYKVLDWLEDGRIVFSVSDEI